MSSQTLRALAYALTAMLLGGQSFAQSMGAFRGTVIDSTKAVVPGVTVEAVPLHGGTTAVTTTGRDGSYALTVAPGVYSVAFRLINFATTVRRDVVVTENQTTSVDCTLYLSATAEVVVTAKQTFRNLTDIDDPVNDLIGVADAASVGVITAREIDRRPFSRAGEVMETVPGVVVSQHSGEGKANQYYLRGFNLDHGTDFAITVAGVPVNLPTHAHGQGYADANFVIPELISGLQYKKGPYYASEGDFASAGSVNVNYVNVLDRPFAVAEGGTFGYGRLLFADAPKALGGFLLYGLEASQNDGPWARGDDFRKRNGILRYSRGDQRSGLSVTAMAYAARWNATDQIPERAVAGGLISRFGLIDASDGGRTSRYSLASEWQSSGSTSLTQIAAYAFAYDLNLFSNFTYFLDDPVNGDQFEQADRRRVYGVRASRRWLATFGGVAAENVAGFQGRVDDIGRVALYRTRERQRLGTVRDDSLRESSGSLFGESSLRWSDHFRSVIGLRADSYRFPARRSIVSPKLSLIFGPWRNTEVYAGAGYGFHSNDARGVAIDADPLVRSKGAEIGMRSTPFQRLHTTASLWALDLASELVFVGDAGTTEASRASRRTGVEIGTGYRLGAISIDADFAYSRARFRSGDPAGDRIPGAVEGVASVSVALVDAGRWTGEVRGRYFGPRPLIEDNSIRSRSSNTLNARLGFAITPKIRVDADVFNMLDARVSDVDYYYTSRLRGEAAGGVDDVHFHPIESRAVRLALKTTF